MRISSYIASVGEQIMSVQSDKTLTGLEYWTCMGIMITLLNCASIFAYYARSAYLRQTWMIYMLAYVNLSMPYV